MPVLLDTMLQNGLFVGRRTMLPQRRGGARSVPCVGPGPLLTRSEVRILELVALGLSTEAMAARLFVSPQRSVITLEICSPNLKSGTVLGWSPRRTSWESSMAMLGPPLGPTQQVERDGVSLTPNSCPVRSKRMADTAWPDCNSTNGITSRLAVEAT